MSTSRISPILPLIVTAMLAAVVVVGWQRGQMRPPEPAVFSTAGFRGDQRRCAECHSDITDQFALAPHSRTLHRADSSELAERFAGRTFHRPDTGVAYRYHKDGDQLMVSTPAYPRGLPISWLVGSGTHALTPLILFPDSAGRTTAIEHSVSWYADGELGVTLGADGLTASSGLQALGRHWPAAETANCFGCHATHVPVENGHIVLDHLQANIGCVRCHGNTQRHLDEVDAGHDPTIERLSSLSPIAAVERCGECHRRASELGGEIQPDNQTIVRFAPVGLVQSPCFQKQHEVTLANGEAARLDCATCHNPHRPARHDWQHHVAACLTCHDQAHGRAVDCPVAPREDNCLPCHMPAVPSNPQLKFTDHWIRVRADR